MAIEHDIRRVRAGAAVVHLTAEKFAREHLAAAGEGRLENFRARYRKFDVLLLDDIQRLAGCAAPVLWSLRELFEPERQIVLTCDCPLVDLNLSNPELMACLHDADAAEITAPDLGTRRAILRAKAEAIGADLPPPVLELLAVCLPGSVRRLEGALFRVARQARDAGGAAVLALTEDILRLDFSAKAPPRHDSPV
jgi:chromosomal replication initiator protein